MNKDKETWYRSFMVMGVSAMLAMQGWGLKQTVLNSEKSAAHTVAIEDLKQTVRENNMTQTQKNQDQDKEISSLNNRFAMKPDELMIPAHDEKANRKLQ